MFGVRMSSLGRIISSLTMTFKIMVVQISSFGGPNFKFEVDNFEFEAEITSFGA